MVTAVQYLSKHSSNLIKEVESEHTKLFPFLKVWSDKPCPRNGNSSQIFEQTFRKFDQRSRARAYQGFSLFKGVAE